MVWKPIKVDEAEVRANSKSATKKARFHLDESIDPVVAEVLRDRGLNVVTGSELGLARQCDEDQLAAAKRNDRILLTHDQDFLADGSRCAAIRRRAQPRDPRRPQGVGGGGEARCR